LIYHILPQLFLIHLVSLKFSSLLTRLLRLLWFQLPRYKPCFFFYFLYLQKNIGLLLSYKALQTDDRCFKVDLYNFWWPERTPSLQQN